MFGVLKDVIEAGVGVAHQAVDSTIKKAVKEAGEFIDNPIERGIDIGTAPIEDALVVAYGLTEGEIRTRAIARLGADVVGGMALSELIEELGI